MRVWVVAIAAAVIAAGCGSDTRPGADGGASASSAAPPLYEVDATVLENGNGPQLCAGMVLTSRPPQCAGTRVIGWDWATVEPKETESGTTWGAYHLVGTYDGATFALTEPPGPFRPPPAEEPDFSTPCSPPGGGWAVVDPTKVAFDDYQRFSGSVNQSADFAGMWADAKSEVRGADGAPVNYVFTVAYTGDLERHREELAAMWGGAICVVERPRTEASLAAIADELIDGGGKSFGLDVQSTAVDDLNNRVTITVMAIDANTQARLDERYGTGVVHVTAHLHPLR
jgi:hypothetical protein